MAADCSLRTCIVETPDQPSFRFAPGKLAVRMVTLMDKGEKNLDALFDKYFHLLKEHMNSPEETYLPETSNLGREMVDREVSLKEIGEFHQKASLGMADTSQIPPPEKTTDPTTAFFLEVLTAYGLAFRERTESFCEQNADVNKAERRTRALMEHVADGIITIGKDGRIESVNKAAQAMFGYVPEELIGQKVNMLMNSHDRDHHDEYLENYIRTSVSKILGKGPREVAALRKDGTLFPMELTIGEMVQEERRVFIGTMRDVTERKKMEDLERQYEKHLQSIMDFIPDAVITSGENGDIISFNRAAEKLFHVSYKEAHSLNLGVFFPDQETGEQGDFAAFIRSLGGIGHVRDCTLEISGLRMDGAPVPLEISLSEMGNDREKQFIVTLRDITRKKKRREEKKELEDQLYQAQKMESLGTLAGGIAHEINTPAQYIGDNLKFLTGAYEDMFSLVEKSLALTEAVRGHDGFSAMAKDIDAVRDEIDLEYLRQEIPSATEQSLSGIGQVSRIVLAMKEFSHPGAKEMSLADINKALENTLTISRNEWKHVAEVTTAFDKALPAVSCLAGELNQVFLNLIVNAAHAVADKPGRPGLGRINVSTESDGDHVIIRIEDDGTGIPDGVRGKVFNPFFTTKEVGQGTGQGLAISHDIVVRRHGGTITFDTEAGKGTTFAVRLPVRAAQPAGTSPSVAGDSDGVSGAEP